MVHPTADVRKRSTEVRTDEFQVGVAIEQSRGDDASHRNGILEHVSEGAGQFVSFDLFGGHRLGGMEQDRNTQFLGAGIEPVKLGFVAPGPCEVGVEENADKAEFLDASIEFSGRCGFILHWQSA